MPTEPSLPARRRTGRPSREEATQGPDAATALLHAAGAEFVEFGFEHTTTNRIARRAGFAPQTFYRWYEDKLDVFIKVLEAWTDAELTQLEAMLTERADGLQIAEAFVEHYRTFTLFKRSLHQLAITTPAVRHARAQCRLRQLAQVRRWNPALAQDEAIAALLIEAELLSQALAEGEFEDMGLRGDAAWARLVALLARLRP